MVQAIEAHREVSAPWAIFAAAVRRSSTAQTFEAVQLRRQARRKDVEAET